MPHWEGNNYNRKKSLQTFLDNLNPEELQEYGKQQTNKEFMCDYNYSSFDKKQTALEQQKQVIPYGKIILDSKEQKQKIDFSKILYNFTHQITHD